MVACLSRELIDYIVAVYIYTSFLPLVQKTEYNHKIKLFYNLHNHHPS